MFLWIYWRFSRYPFRRVSHQFGIGLFLLLMALVSFAMVGTQLSSFVGLLEVIIFLIIGFIVIIIAILNKRRIVASWDDDDDDDNYDDDDDDDDDV